MKGDGTAGRWFSPLELHILPRLGKRPVAEIDQIDIRDALAPIWHDKAESARKALGRLELCLKHAAALGLDVDLQGPEKARALLGRQRHSATHIPAMPWAEVPAFYQTLAHGTVTHLALRLLILTGARSAPIRFARNEQFDGDLWTIPADRMKGRKDRTAAFRVPLSREAQAVVMDAKRHARDGFLFPGLRKEVISDATMAKLLSARGLSARPHGFRSSFRDWISCRNPSSSAEHPDGRNPKFCQSSKLQRRSVVHPKGTRSTESPFVPRRQGRRVAVPLLVLAQGSQLPHQSVRSSEIPDMRKLPIYEEPAIPSAYELPLELSDTPAKRSTGLPVGTQAKFIAAANEAEKLGHPLNTLLTMRWKSLPGHSDENAMPVHERIHKLVELLRKWLNARGIPPCYIWVRETVEHELEHWHIALPIPRQFCDQLVAYMVKISGEPAARNARIADRTEGEFARGEAGSWHLAKDTHPERQGFYLAAYLGKGEPSQRMFRGKLQDNTRKPVRGCSFGGNRPDGKYDVPQGELSGTACREDRFFIANLLKAKMPAKAQGRKQTGTSKTKLSHGVTTRDGASVSPTNSEHPGVI